MGFVRRLRLRFAPSLVIVSGLPRSGTSMAIKMLEAGGIPPFTDAVRQADEDNPKGYYEFERVKRLHEEADKGWVRECRGKALKVISFLLPELPSDLRYRVIFMDRALEEVVASQNKMLQRRGEPLRDDGAVKAMFEEHLRGTRRWLARQENFAVLEVPYSEVVRSPEEQARRIRDFLGEERLDLRRMAEVVDPNLYRNRA